VEPGLVFNLLLIKLKYLPNPTSILEWLYFLSKTSAPQVLFRLMVYQIQISSLFFLIFFLKGKQGHPGVPITGKGNSTELDWPREGGRVGWGSRGQKPIEDD